MLYRMFFILKVLFIYISDCKSFKFRHSMRVAYMSDLQRKMLEAVLCIVLNGYIGRKHVSILLN